MEARKDEYGHRKMLVWQRLDEIEKIVYDNVLTKIPRTEFNLRDQIDRATSSMVANFIEGYYSGSIKEYLKFLGYSRRSLAELQDWIRRTCYKKYIDENLYLKIDDLCIKAMFLSNRLVNALKAKIIPKP